MSFSCTFRPNPGLIRAHLGIPASFPSLDSGETFLLWNITCDTSIFLYRFRAIWNRSLSLDDHSMYQTRNLKTEIRNPKPQTRVWEAFGVWDAIWNRISARRFRRRCASEGSERESPLYTAMAGNQAAAPGIVQGYLAHKKHLLSLGPPYGPSHCR